MKVGRSILATLLLATLLVAAGAALAAPGDPDPSFGTGGIAKFAIGSSDDSANRVVLQPDGKPIVVGRAAYLLALARYNTDGSLDVTFGTNGRATLDTGGTGWDAVVQADGRIVVSRWCASAIPCLTRFDADGRLDTSFDASELQLAGSDNARALALQPDQKILVGANNFGVVRLLPSGALDTAFGIGGRASVDVPGAVARAVLLQADGAIVVVGYVHIAAGNPRVVVRRFTAQGAVDSSFVDPAIAGRYTINAARLQPDGKVVMAGCFFHTTSITGDRFAAIRLLPGGTPDPTFQGGISTLPIESCVSDMHVDAQGRIVSAALQQTFPPTMEVIRLTPAGALDLQRKPDLGGRQAHSSGIALQPDGKILLAGDRFGLGGFDFALARLDDGGTLDSAFGNGGVAATDFQRGRFGQLRGLRAGPGHFVVLSEMASSIYEGSAGVARVLADGTLDPSFGDGGQVTAALAQPTSSESVQALALQPDGKVLLAGWGVLGGTAQAIAMRLTASGAPDPAFGSGGRTGVEPGALLLAVEALPGGKVVVAGASQVAAVANVFVMRLMADGSPDPTFGNAGKVVLPTGGEGYLLRLTLAPQADGKVVIAGLERNAMSAARLLDNGSLDPTFGIGGRAAFPGGHAGPSVVHAGGGLTLVNNVAPTNICSDLPDYRAAFARLSPAGSLPPGTSILTSELGRKAPYIAAARLDAQDRLVAVGSHFVTCVPGTPGINRLGHAAVFRFTPAGALDTSFGVNGSVLLGGNTSSYPTFPAAFEVVTLPDGKMVVATSSSFGFALHRLLGGGDSAPAPLAGDVDADGLPDTVEPSEGRDPLLRDNDVFASARLYVMQQYRDFLGREGDATGITSWTNFMTGAETRATVADRFLRSAEFEGTVAPMTRLYFAYFLRIPDYGGLNFWISQFRSGNSLDAISNQFAASPEFVNTYGALDNAGFVDRVYRNVLGRAPDAGGLAHWSGQLDAGMTRGQMMVQFSESPEYRALIASEVYVTMVYAGMLRRAPDAGGFAHWVSYLDAGNSGVALVNAFLDAPEYRARFLP